MTLPSGSKQTYFHDFHLNKFATEEVCFYTNRIIALCLTLQ